MQHFARPLGRMVPLVFALALSGCALGPIDGQTVGTNNAVNFWGTTTAGSAPVRLQAYVFKLVGWELVWEWQTMKTVTASTTALIGDFNVELYGWNGSANVPTRAFLGSYARVRAQTFIDGAWRGMVMYDQAGYDCVEERYGDALETDEEIDVATIGYECSGLTNGGTPRYEVRVRRP